MAAEENMQHALSVWKEHMWHVLGQHDAAAPAKKRPASIEELPEEVHNLEVASPSISLAQTWFHATTKQVKCARRKVHMSRAASNKPLRSWVCICICALCYKYVRLGMSFGRSVGWPFCLPVCLYYVCMYVCMYVCL